MSKSRDRSLSSIKLDNALSLLIKHVVTSSLETNERLDKLKDVLTRDLKKDENIDDLIEGLASVQSEQQLQWSNKLLKQFNRVYKYEKEQEWCWPIVYRQSVTRGGAVWQEEFGPRLDTFQSSHSTEQEDTSNGTRTSSLRQGFKDGSDNTLTYTRLL